MGVTPVSGSADRGGLAGRLWRLAPLVLLVVSVPSASATREHLIRALAPVEVLAAGFGSLRGVAVDGAGSLYVADAAAGTVTRLTPDGARALVATGLERPIGLALDLDGRLLVAEARAGRVVGVEADGRRTPMMTNVSQPRWLAVSDAGRLFVAARGLTPSRREPDDEAAEPEVILTAGLDDPQGLAFDVDGSLYVADGRSGRVVRFRAPPPPSLTALPAFTNQVALAVGGTTDPSARLDVVLNGGTPSVVVADATGRFALSVAPALDTENLLQVLATARAGRGLTSAPAEARLTHDGVSPSLAFQAPGAGAFVRQAVQVAAQASDARSQLDDLSLGVGAQRLGGGVTPPLPAPSAVATATWNTLGVADGAQTLLAVAIDRAGNRTLVSRSVIVDNTPPDTRITGGPSATMPDAATFDFPGGDNLTPVASLEFAWRVDGGRWSAFGSATRVTVSGLVPGSHLFEVKARDLA